MACPRPKSVFWPPYLKWRRSHKEILRFKFWLLLLNALSKDCLISTVRFRICMHMIRCVAEHRRGRMFWVRMRCTNIMCDRDMCLSPQIVRPHKLVYVHDFPDLWRHTWPEVPTNTDQTSSWNISTKHPFSQVCLDVCNMVSTAICTSAAIHHI